MCERTLGVVFMFSYGWQLHGGIASLIICDLCTFLQVLDRSPQSFNCFASQFPQAAREQARALQAAEAQLSQHAAALAAAEAAAAELRGTLAAAEGRAAAAEEQLVAAEGRVGELEKRATDAERKAASFKERLDAGVWWQGGGAGLFITCLAPVL